MARRTDADDDRNQLEVIEYALQKRQVHFEAVLLCVRFIGNLHAGHFLRLADAFCINRNIAKGCSERIDRRQRHALKIDAVGGTQEYNPLDQAASSFKLAVRMGGRWARILVTGVRRDDHLCVFFGSRHSREQLRDRALERRWFRRVEHPGNCCWPSDHTCLLGIKCYISSMQETVAKTKYWHRESDGRLQCDLCPRHCRLREGQRGLCYVRQRLDDEIKLVTYGRSSGFCVDPIEKKPLNHFYPGSSVLSFGTAGCNLACKFCQNWDMTKSREMDTLADSASPEHLAEAAEEFGCKSIAYTYNDPIIFLEYAVDIAEACRERGIKSVAVTAGYVDPEPREEFFQAMDAANVDLKAFTDRFYHKICGGHLSPVLETLEYIHTETEAWLETTTLLIPGENDSDEELDQMTQWVVEHLGPDVPMHFSAFHPDWKMLDVPSTPAATLTRARKIAMDNGVHFAYTGNVHDSSGGSTYCPRCKELVIERDWYELGKWRLDENGACLNCGTEIPGYFDATPGNFGARRIPVRLGS